MKKERAPISKHTLNLFAGDMEALQAIAGSRIGASKMIREMVHRYLADHGARFQSKTQLPPIEVDL